MGTGLGIGIGIPFGGVSSIGALALIGQETDGIAIDFTDGSAVIRDSSTPANNFQGGVNSLLTYTSPSTKYLLGANGIYSAASTLRNEYDASGNKLGMRFEVQHTNLATNSTDLDTQFATQTNCTFTPGHTDPFGGSNGHRVQVTTTGAAVALSNIGTVAATTVGVSLFVKKGSGATDANRFAIYNVTAASALYFISVNYDTLAITEDVDIANGESSLENIGNGWYRLRLGCDFTSGHEVRVYAGLTGTSETAGEYADIAQLDVIAGTKSPGSPIVTSGSTAQRNRDDVSLDLTNTPFSDGAAGSAYVRWTPRRIPPASLFEYVWNLSDGSTVDVIGQYMRHTTGVTRLAVSSASVFQADLQDGAGTTLAVGTNYRTASAWAANDFAVSTNGAAVGTDVSGSVPTSLNVLRLMNYFVSSTTYGHMQQFLYVPRRISNGDLVTFSSTGELP